MFWIYTLIKLLYQAAIFILRILFYFISGKNCPGFKSTLDRRLCRYLVYLSRAAGALHYLMMSAFQRFRKFLVVTKPILIKSLIHPSYNPSSFLNSNGSALIRHMPSYRSRWFSVRINEIWTLVLWKIK